MQMIQGFLILLLCQLIGEVGVYLLDVPIPGSVVGMVILLIGLLVYGTIPEGLSKTSDGLISVLPLLLVPAGVGLMQHFGVLADNWLALLTALIVSTLVTLLAVALVLKCLSKEAEQDK